MDRPEIEEICNQLIAELKKTEDISELIECLNYIRSRLHELSQ